MIVVVGLVLASTLSCHPTATPVSGRPPVAEAPANGTWSGASWEEHHDTMTFVVLPNMARTFQRFGRRPYPEMSCVTCHGADGENVRYRMPNALPPLDPAHLPTATSPDPAVARTTRFMIEEVTPQLAELTDDPTVSCFTCHPSTAR